MIGGAAAALYWLDLNQEPVGYFHEDAPPMPRELFQNQMKLFEGPGEMSAFWLARQTGKSIGRLVDPPASFFDSNVYNLLIKGSGHRHTLDVRIDVDGVGRAVFGLFRIADDPFRPSEIDAIRVIQPLFARAIVNGQSGPHWTPDHSSRASLAVSADCEMLMACSSGAARLLANSSLIGQHLSCDPARLSRPPRFISALLQGANLAAPRSETYPVPGGRLSVRADWMGEVGSDPTRGFWSVELQMLTCREIEMVDVVLGRKLSPLQKEVALYALLGGERKNCAERFALSAASLKIHLRAILREFDSPSWNDLRSFGRATSTPLPTPCIAR